MVRGVPASARRGGLHLAWIDGGFDRKEVFYVHLDDRGRPDGQPRRVSAPGVEVTLLAAAPTADGGLALALDAPDSDWEKLSA